MRMRKQVHTLGAAFSARTVSLIVLIVCIYTYFVRNRKRRREGRRLGSREGRYRTTWRESKQPRVQSLVDTETMELGDAPPGPARIRRTPARRSPRRGRAAPRCL
ncbi:hypothetical protein [Lysobacter gummosus]|uniref:hypothetical protein n=1 Tax=Lysobacter gummosus TaxID=262324 RepID=UPI00362E9EF3